jgi:hypothetical protein
MKRLKLNKILVEGITKDGATFRPSDWAERISANLSTFEGQRLKYSSFLQPVIQNNKKCMLVDIKLKKENFKLYQFVLEFAKINNLNICASI